MSKKIILLLVACLSLGASPLGANGFKKKVIIDPQYITSTDKLNCEKTRAVNDIIHNIVNALADCFDKDKDYSVALTNVAEIYVEDNKRSKIANDSSGDILISITVLCSNDDKEIEIVNSMIEFKEMPKNASSGKKSISEEDILNDLKQDSLKKFNKGVVLSRLIQKEMVREKIKISKEIKFEPVELLIGANMPATLVKIPYLEKLLIGHDGKQLENKKFISRLVKSICAGVDVFFSLCMSNVSNGVKSTVDP